jgi:chemotaxis signal transduction protein
MTASAAHETALRDDALLCCDVGVERYAFRNTDVRHIERAEHLQPHSGGDGRLGALTLGDQHVPVFGLGRALGRSPIEGHSRIRDSYIAVTGDRHALVGWLVDRIARPHSGVTNLVPLPTVVGAPATSWFDAIVQFADETAALLIAPRHLHPISPATAPRTIESVFEPPRPPARARLSEPVAVVFSTGALPDSAGRRCALSGRQIAGIVQPTAVIPVPGCAPFVVGITWWRGAAVPVVDFRAPDQRPASPPHRRLIAQCDGRHRGALVAFSIDSEVVMWRPTGEDRLLPDAVCPPFTFGVFDVGGDAVGLLDLGRLVAPGARAALASA